jgi:DNA-binding HxlR family transcriptional regulator
MRSYSQYCSVARALDVVGDRWTLLIVRELLLRGRLRYTDLRDGLPGIATNLLADRLKVLQEEGLIASEEAPAPIAATLYDLTPRGRELEPVLNELGRWGGPLMVSGPREQDRFRSHWLSLPFEVFLTDSAPSADPIKIEVRTEDEPVTLEAADGVISTRLGAPDDPDAVIAAPAQIVLGTLTGYLSLDQARELGLRYEGDPAHLARITPSGG